MKLIVMGTVQLQMRLPPVRTQLTCVIGMSLNSYFISLNVMGTVQLL